MLIAVARSHAARCLTAGSSDLAEFETLARESLAEGSALVVTTEDDGSSIDLRRPQPDGRCPLSLNRLCPGLLPGGASALTNTRQSNTRATRFSNEGWWLCWLMGRLARPQDGARS